MQYRLMGYGVELRTVEQDDIELLRNWRNREDIRSMMKSTSYITKEQQQAWFESLEEATHVRHFLISYKGQNIGSATLTGVKFVAGFTDDLENASEIEPGLYIGEEKFRNNILAFAPSLVACDYCFDELQVKKLIATVNRENKQALAYNNKLGYKEESRFFSDLPSKGEAVDTHSDNHSLANESQQEWIKMTLNYDDYIAATKQVRNLLSRR